MEINGKTYEVTGYVEMEDGTTLPIVDIPMMSDDRWNELCLQSRLEHPEYYEDIENVSEVIERLKKKTLSRRLPSIT